MDYCTGLSQSGGPYIGGVGGLFTLGEEIMTEVSGCSALCLTGEL